MHTKTLILRLSSLGDVILASSVLEINRPNAQLDWVVSKEYSELLRGHPKLHRLFVFDRKQGLKGWVFFCREIWRENYSEVYDLHRSLRTRFMKILFIYWSLKESTPSPLWKSISKEKLKLYLYYLLKKRCPQRWRPTLWVQKFVKLMGGTGQERPNLKHLLKDQENLQVKSPYLCVMPSSRWDGKKWPVENYVKTLRNLPYFPVIFGSSSDVVSLQLAEQLARHQIPYLSGVGKWNLAETANLLANSVGYLGSDTGLAHLAEAVGVPVKVISGPTVPDMGFGPWRRESRAIGISLACRPCGKDGRYCYRFTQKHQCLKALSPETVLETFNEF
jgi:ADP-heptose:LPS heptosyltransferase